MIGKNIYNVNNINKKINMQTFTFDVNGIMFRPKKIIKQVADDINLNDQLYLERDENNKYDKYAVKVFYGTSWIGYVEKLYSKEVSELIDSNKKFSCNVFIVDADWGFDITDSGREVEFVKYVTLIAEIKLE